MPQIVTVTVNPALDKSTAVRQLVAERKLPCRPPRIEPGGGGINVARAIRRLGGEATALWSRGGPMGQLAGRLLENEGVPHQAIPIAGETRENFIVYEETSEQQYRFGMPGPHLEQDDLDRWIEAIDGLAPPPEYVIASGSLPPGTPTDFYGRIVGRLPSSCRVIVDTKQEPLREAADRGIYLIKPNLRELAGLTGERPGDEQAIERQARMLVDQGKVQVVVVSLGSGGAMLVTADTVAHLRSPTVPIRSKVGAGDSMVAGIVLSLARGKSVCQAAAFGVAAGAAAVMTPGTELCRREDVERIWSEMAARQPAVETGS
jgi:6-phosphofructokinase 2